MLFVTIRIQPQFVGFTIPNLNTKRNIMFPEVKHRDMRMAYDRPRGFFHHDFEPFLVSLSSGPPGGPTLQPPLRTTTSS